MHQSLRVKEAHRAITNCREGRNSIQLIIFRGYFLLLKVLTIQKKNLNPPKPRMKLKIFKGFSSQFRFLYCQFYQITICWKNCLGKMGIFCGNIEKLKFILYLLICSYLLHPKHLICTSYSIFKLSTCI